jgi:predicted outer membrane repeat protein
VSGVSGSGGVYTVTVNTGIGSGTIRLDVVDNNSILDAASNPLGGPAVGDGNFGSGEFYTISKLIYANQNASGANNGISWVNAYTDLQSALLVASSGDEIWVAAGKYKPTTGTDRAVSFVLKSGVAVYGGFAGIETLRTQRNSAANVTILSGDIGAAGTADNSYHVVIGEGSVSAAVLAGFTVVSGNANGTDPNGFDFVGGGIVNFGFLNIENSIISNNSAIDNGGGIENSGTLNIVTSTVSNNSSVMGGGILNLGESLQVTNSKISGNTAMVGGGIYNVSTLNLTSSTVSSNSATIDGGGILSSGTINVENSTFVGNSAEHDGGGIASGGVDTIANSTFSNNSAVNVGGGIAHGGFPLNMSNTIIANSTSGGDCYIDITGGAAMGVGSHNLIESNAASPNNCGTPISTADPILGALANNGGFTQTFALLPGSPAINAGTDTGCPATDQRGVIRPQGSHCDIGAYELYMPQVKTITRIDVNPTVLTSVRFTVTFYESVMGVDTGDFSLTTIGGVFGASVTSVSGSGATYTVTVNTGSGRGMLRLNIVDDNSILNAASSPLGGPALGDGNFGSGEFYTINKPIQDVVTDTWAVKVSPSANVSQLALQLGAQNLGQIGSLPGYYLFRISGSNTQPKTATDLLAANPQVLWFEQQTAHKQSARGNSNQNGNPAEVITATAMIEDVQSQDNADNVSATNTPSDTVSTVPTETAITIIESSQLPAFTQTIAPLLQVLPIPTQTPIVQIQPSSIPTKPVQPTKIVVLSNKPLEIPTTMIRSAIPITGSENNSSNVGTMAAILIILTLAAGGIFFTLRYVK